MIFILRWNVNSRSLQFMEIMRFVIFIFIVFEFFALIEIAGGMKEFMMLVNHVRIWKKINAFELKAVVKN